MPKHFMFFAMAVAIIVTSVGCATTKKKAYENGRGQCIKNMMQSKSIEGTIKSFRIASFFPDLCPNYSFRIRGRTDESLRSLSEYTRNNFNFQDILIFRIRLSGVSWGEDHIVTSDVRVIRSLNSSGADNLDGRTN